MDTIVELYIGKFRGRRLQEVNGEPLAGTLTRPAVGCPEGWNFQPFQGSQCEVMFTVLSNAHGQDYDCLLRF